jgi:hypothetical protein
VVCLETSLLTCTVLLVDVSKELFLRPEIRRDYYILYYSPLTVLIPCRVETPPNVIQRLTFQRNWVTILRYHSVIKLANTLYKAYITNTTSKKNREGVKKITI